MTKHIAINSFGASHQIKMFAMARVEHKGPPMPFMGPLGGPEYAAANPINLHCHCALAYPGWSMTAVLKCAHFFENPKKYKNALESIKDLIKRALVHVSDILYATKLSNGSLGWL
jgi:hypothetical protein